MSTPQCPSSYPDVNVTASATSSGNVWGSNPYTNDSNVAKAIVHQGLVPAGQTARIRKKNVGYITGHVGSTANGVTTLSYSSYWCSVKLYKVAYQPNETKVETSTSSVVDSVLVEGETETGRNTVSDDVVTESNGATITTTTLTTTIYYSTPTTTTTTTTVRSEGFTRTVDALTDEVGAVTYDYGSWLSTGVTNTPTTESVTTYEIREEVITEVSSSSVATETNVVTSSNTVIDSVVEGVDVESSREVVPSITTEVSNGVTTVTTVTTTTIKFSRDDTVTKTTTDTTKTYKRLVTTNTDKDGNVTTSYSSWTLDSTVSVPTSFSEVIHNIDYRTETLVTTEVTTRKLAPSVCLGLGFQTTTKLQLGFTSNLDLNLGFNICKQC